MYTYRCAGCGRIRTKTDYEISDYRAAHHEHCPNCHSQTITTNHAMVVTFTRRFRKRPDRNLRRHRHIARRMKQEGVGAVAQLIRLKHGKNNQNGFKASDPNFGCNATPIVVTELDIVRATRRREERLRRHVWRSFHFDHPLFVRAG